MSLTSIMSAIGTYVADEIVNEYGYPTPDAIVRYHGKTIPGLTVTEAGILGIGWNVAHISTAFPIMRSHGAHGTPQAGFVVERLWISYQRCWPALVITKQGPITNWAQRDEVSAGLAELQDGITRSLFRLECQPGAGARNSEAFDEVFEHLTCRGFQFVDANPIGPNGKIAGVTWQVDVIVVPGAPPS